MRQQIPWSDEAVFRATPLLLLTVLLLIGEVRSGQPISGLPDDGGFDMPESILEPELAQSVWSREGLKNPIRRTTTIPLNDRLDIGNTGELQQPKGGQKPTKRMPRSAADAAIVNEYDALNDDFLTEYDLLNLDFNLDESEDEKRSAKEVEVPEKEFKWEEQEEEKRSRAEKDNFPPKEWWDLDEPEGTSTTAASKRPTLRGSKVLRVEDEEENEADEQHPLALDSSQQRESGRVRRNAKTESAGQTHRGIGEWSGEAAIGRDEVKIWPKLVPLLTKSELGLFDVTVPTTKQRTSTTPTLPMGGGNKRISGGNDAHPTKDESKKDGKKAEIFRDLPSGVEVAASLVEKTVDNRQQNSNTTQRPKKVGGRVQSKKQNGPSANSSTHILDRDSPESANLGRMAASEKDGGNLSTTNRTKAKNQAKQRRQQRPDKSAKPSSQRQHQHQQEIERLIDSLPTIIIGESEQRPADHHSSDSSFKPEPRNLSVIEADDQKAEQNANHKSQIEVAPAELSPQLPPGFVYLATVETLPKNGRLIIGNQSYVIEKTLLQRHLFNQPQQQQRGKMEVANDADGFGTGKKPNDSLMRSDQQQQQPQPSSNGDGDVQQQQTETKEQLMMQQTVIGNVNTTRTKSGRRHAPRNKAYVVTSSQQQQVAPTLTAPPARPLADHFGPSDAIAQNGKKTNSRVLNSKTSILAQNLGLALSQIFGNFTIGNFPEKNNKLTTANEKAQKQQTTEPTMSTENGENGGRAEEQVVSEAHRLTRVFERKRP